MAMTDWLPVGSFATSILAMGTSAIVYVRQERQKAALVNRLSEDRFTELYASLNELVIQYPELWALFGDNPCRIPSPQIRRRMRALCFLQLNIFASVCACYHYGTRRLVQHECAQWQAWLATIKSFLFESAFARSMWEDAFTRRHYHRDFRRLLDQLKAEVDTALVAQGAKGTQGDRPSPRTPAADGQDEAQ
jgi:hypothetical protein